MKINYKIIAILFGAFLLVFMGSATSFWSFRQIELSAQRRAHTNDILKRSQGLQSSLIDAETGTRGYLLTGDKAYLEPYWAVHDSFKSQIEELRQMILIDTAREHLDVMAPLVDAKLAHLSRTIELYGGNEVTAAIEMVHSGEGKRLMDSIRVEISSIDRIEEDALAHLETEYQANMRLLFIIIAVASIFMLLLALSFAYLIYRETQQRLKNLVHIETQRFLEIQNELNKQLQLVNATLRVSEEKLAVTLNSIGDAVIATDVDGLVTILNPLAEELTGWTKAQSIGLPVTEIFRIINEETRLPAVVPVMETLRQGTVQGLANHTVLIARDDSECAIADSCAPIRDRNDQVVGAVLVFRDVTERNRLDHLLRDRNVELESARSVAERANLAKSEFLSSMSHELRSPLNAILGFAQLMESASPPPTLVQQESIEQISQAGWHLLKLINEVLDLSKVEARLVTISPEPVSLEEVLLECQSMVEPQAQARQVKLILPSFENPYFVEADRTRLKQVFINLLSNAIKYNLERGTVEVTCAANTSGSIRVSIRDSGAGLSPEKQAQLFQAFNRLGQETGSVEGTGIGLVVSKRLVELMGGVIGVQSTVGVGSTFWFELHAVDAPHLSTEMNGPNVLKLPRLLQREVRFRTVLYVEDNPANLRLVEQIIARDPDLRLLSAVDGTSGIRLARASQPEVILMDINLPDISGIEVMKILRSDPSTAHIPVVALSANAMPRDIKKGLEAGFFRYITKPIKLNEFIDALNVALEFAEIQPEAIE